MATSQLARSCGSAFFNGQTIFLRPIAPAFEAEFKIEIKEWGLLCKLLESTAHPERMRRAGTSGLRMFLKLARGGYSEPEPAGFVSGIDLTKGDKRTLDSRYMVSIVPKYDRRRHTKGAKAGLVYPFVLQKGDCSLGFTANGFSQIRQLCLDFDRLLKKKGFEGPAN